MKKLTTLAVLSALVAGLGLFSLPARADDGPQAQVGAPAPDFTLTDLEGKQHTLSELKGQIVVLEWFNPDCPFVMKHHRFNKDMIELAAKYKDKGVVWLAINSNAEGKQGSGLERNQRAVQDYEMEYPVLLDPTGQVGRSYGARTTPAMYVIDAEGVLRYAGAIDNDRSPRKLGDTNYVQEALDAILAGKEVPTKETRSYGCSVKYAKAS